MKKGKLMKLMLAMLFVFSSAILPAATNPVSDLSIISRVTANILSSKQFRKHPLDDELSKQLLQEYLDMLDPNRMYFTKEDVEEFKQYETDLDDELLSGDISVAFKIYDRLIERLEEYQAFAHDSLKKGFDFTKDESFVYDRKKAERPTRAEQKELWRKRLKYDLLAFKLIDRAAKEEVAKDKKEEEKQKVAKLWEKSPEERLLKRIDNLVKSIKGKRDVDRLQFFLASLAQIYDPHSLYMAPKAAANFDIAMKNSLVGIGAVLTTDDGYTKISSIIKGGPADKEGHLEAEDRIVAVAQGDNEPVDIVDMPLDDVVQLIRGKKGTVVNLYVLKGNKGLHGVPEVISITRDKVELKNQDAQGDIIEVTVNGEKKKIGVIDLPSFYIDFRGAAERKPDYKSCARDVKNILEDFRKKGVDGVIMDLRNNGGGSLSEAIKLTGLFIPKGPIVQVKGPDVDTPQVQSDYDGKSYYSGPLMVLTSKYSASAAEIFAAAIQDYGRGIIVGDAHTHGKGTVQTVLNLNDLLKHWGLKSDPGTLKITIAKFYRINGESTQMKGVEPDIEIASLTDPMKIGEKYLDHALKWDTITPAHYTHTDLGKTIEALKKASVERRAADPKFKERKEMIARYKETLDRKENSLNEEKRWKEYLEDKKIFDRQAALMKKESDDDAKDKKRENDLTFQEGLNIMKDWLAANSNHDSGEKADKAKK